MDRRRGGGAGRHSDRAEERITRGVKDSEGVRQTDRRVTEGTEGHTDSGERQKHDEEERKGNEEGRERTKRVKA